MSQVTITTEQVHELIEQLAAMTAAASITPEIVANIFEKMRNLNDQEREKVIAVAEAKIAEIQDIGIAADHVTLDSGVTVEEEMQKKAYMVELYQRSASLPLPKDATYYYKGLPTHSVVGTAYDSKNGVYTDYIGICYEHEPDEGNEPQHHTVMVFVKNNGEYWYRETFNTMEASGYLQQHIARAFGSVNATVSYSGLMSAQDKRGLNDLVKQLDNIDKESTQSEEQAIIYETDGGVQVGKINANGADFANLKRGGQQVARMSDLPTKDTSIGDTPSTTHVPTTEAVKTYVDSKVPVIPDYPIETETTQSEDEEQVWGDDSETQEYAKIGSYGIKSKAYLDMEGNSVIPIKDNSIGDSPSQTNVPTSKAVADYVGVHGGGTGNLPIDKESVQSEDEEVKWQNDNGTETYVKVGPYGIKTKALLDMNGNDLTSQFNGKLILPKYIPHVIGTEQYIYWESILKGAYSGKDESNRAIIMWASHWALKRCCGGFVLKTNASGQVGVTTTKLNGNFNTTINLVYNGKAIESKTVTFRRVPRSASGTFKLLCVGDSKTENATKHAELANLCQKDGNISVTFLGTKHSTRTDSDGNPREIYNEGYSGKSIYDWGHSSSIGGAFYDSENDCLSLTKGFQTTGVPDIIWLDFGSNQAKTDWSTVKAAYDDIINQVKAYNTANSTHIKVVISVQESHCLIDSFYNSDTRKNNMVQSSKTEDYLRDFEDRESEGIFVCPQYVNVDMYNDYMLASVGCNVRNPNLKDYVCLDMAHPGLNMSSYNASKTYRKGEILQYNNEAYLVIKDGVVGITPADDNINYAKAINVNAGYYKMADMYFATLKYIASLN